MRDPGLTCAERERFAHGFESPRLVGGEHARGYALCPCWGGREQNLGPTDRKGECPDPRAPHEGATRDVVHGFLPERCERRHLVRPAETTGATTCQGNWEGPRRPPSFGTVRKIERRFRDRIKRSHAVRCEQRRGGW